MAHLIRAFFQNSKSVNELICLDDSNASSQVDFGGITLNNFTLDDLDDDEFNPRAVEQSQPANSANIVQVANVTTTSPAPAHIGKFRAFFALAAPI